MKAILLCGLAAHIRAQPMVSTRGGDVLLASPTDIRIVRQDPDGTGSGRSASLFRLLDQVEELDNTIADSMSSLRGESAEQARTFQANLTMLSGNLTATLSTFNTTLNGVLENRVRDVQLIATITNAALRRSIATLERADADSATCFAAGKVITAAGCTFPPVLTDRSLGYNCSNATLGRTRWNTNATAYEICAPTPPGADPGTANPLFQPIYTPTAAGVYGTQDNPATSGAALKARRPNAASGMFWIQPPGDATAAETFCDMDYRGGGWCLANVGYVHAPNQDTRNRNMINLNRPNGYRWNPNARASDHMLINLPSGGVNMAKASTHMMMAAGRNPGSGGINGYSHAYEISIAHVTQFLHFKNGNRFHLGCRAMFGEAQNRNVGFVVRGVKGDIGTWNRRSQRESLMLSWSDSYPAGYGFSAQGITAGNNCLGTWGDGPFFPTIHSGDGRGSYVGRWGPIASPPDITNGRKFYTHQGWYGARNGNYNRNGQTSLWFK